ncbi:Harbinger transposase-derived protein, plant [Corchorus olitorius]|uniref:Harbinger transposase-derived protein, plant n=1 Tax=Corchorus olitorius TaxID=93759 RepID=A0A1R3GE87_9ROSI|nr:Harbinger transposase-derived protein, plant [Corchorus olitorius]
MQEACRKDVECAFGVLQSRFAIIKGPSRFWKKEILHDIMSACIIMHNMIIEDERDLNADIENWMEAPVPEVEMVRDETTRFQEFLARYKEIKDKDAHFALRNALIEHLWERYGNSENFSLNM